MRARALTWCVALLGVLLGALPRTTSAATPGEAQAGGAAHPGGAEAGTGSAGSTFVLLHSVTLDGGANGDDQARGLAVDADGNVWVTGYVTVPGHDTDIWLAKYDHDLGFLDSVTVNGPDSTHDEGCTMAFDHDGYVYVIGHVSVEGQDHDIWIGKFDADLVLQKDVTINGTENGTDDGYGILFDEVTGYLYAAGTLREMGEGANAWLAILDTDLAVVDSITLNGPIDNTDKARFMAFDDSRHLFASGSMTQAVTDYDIWLAKFDADLTFIDQVLVAGPTTDEDKGYGIVYGGYDTLFVTGTIIGTSTGYDIWMAAYDTQLAPLDGVTFDGPVHGEDVAYMMTMDGVGRLYHTGVYTEAEGGSNLWVARYDAQLALQDWTTVDGPAGDYDTGMGVANGPDNEVYVSGVINDPIQGFDIWVGHFSVPTLFADGLESGDTGRWTVATTGAVHVAGAAARTGDHGLQVDVSPPCGAAQDVLLNDMTVASPLHVASCASLTAGDGCVVAAGGRLELTARTAVVLEEGFRIEDGGSLTAALDSGLAYAAYVQDDTPTAETAYHAEFFVNLDNLTLDGGDELELLVGYDGAGTPQLRVTVNNGDGIALAVRDDGGAYTTIPGGPVLPGWNKVALGWEASTDATVSLTTNNGTPVAAGGLDNDTCRVDFVRWGAVDGTITSSSGNILLDNFISSR
jgi:hypothetical protein